MASKRLELGSTRWVLAGAVAVYALALLLPFAGGVAGWQVLAFSDAAASVQTKLTEYLFTVLSFIGLGVLTTLAVATRRFPVAALGWMVTTVSLFISVLALWLRRTSTAFDAGYHHGPGIYLAIVAVAVAVFAYIPAVLRRDGAEGTRGERDDVALAQQEATRRAADEENPLLIDDRRARAAERHRKYRES